MRQAAATRGDSGARVLAADGEAALGGIFELQQILYQALRLVGNLVQTE